jgi:hypothetical protein
MIEWHHPITQMKQKVQQTGENRATRYWITKNIWAGLIWKISPWWLTSYSGNARIKGTWKRFSDSTKHNNVKRKESGQYSTHLTTQYHISLKGISSKQQQWRCAMCKNKHKKGHYVLMWKVVMGHVLNVMKTTILNWINKWCPPFSAGIFMYKIIYIWGK